MINNSIKKVELSDNEKEEFLNSLYKSFETGFDFEEFLKPMLELLGLDEVRVTKKSGDGGIDLEGIRFGVIDNTSDSVKYVVQAKRYKPSESIPVDTIDKLRGNMDSGDKGIIISTCRFSKPAKEKAVSKPEKPIVLIGGDELVTMCIEHNIGVVYKPVFSSSELNKFYKLNELTEPVVKPQVSSSEFVVENVEKNITSNDIRARIISIPRAILDVLPDDVSQFVLCINGKEITDVNISSDRRYFAKGITEVYRQFGLLTEDNVYNPGKSFWKYDGKIIYIDIM